MKEKGCAIRAVVHEQVFEKQLARLAKERDERKRFNKSDKGSWGEMKRSMENEKKK